MPRCHLLQDGPPLVFSVATHWFAKRNDWDVVVAKKGESEGESRHAEVCSFARCAALRNLFVRRLRVGERTGDDTGLTPLLWPCAEDLRSMLSPSKECMLGLSRLLRDVTKAVQKYGVRKVCQLSQLSELWQSLRGALGLQST